MRKITNQIYSSITHTLVGDFNRPFSEHLKEMRLALYRGVAHLFTWIPYQTLTTPFGIFIYLFCRAYRFFGTQDAVTFASEAWAGYYIGFLFYCCIILPFLMLLPPTRNFLCSQIGEHTVKKRVGAWGIRPLIGFLSGAYLLDLFDHHTKAASKPSDAQHWQELVTHSEKAHSENKLFLDREYEKLNKERADILKIPPELRDPALVKEFHEKSEATTWEYLRRGQQIAKDTDEMSSLAVQGSKVKVGEVSEFSDRVKDLFRGKDRNRTFWVVDRGLPSGLGLSQYDQSNHVSDLRAGLEEQAQAITSLAEEKGPNTDPTQPQVNSLAEEKGPDTDSTQPQAKPDQTHSTSNTSHVK